MSSKILIYLLLKFNRYPTVTLYSVNFLKKYTITMEFSQGLWYYLIKHTVEVTYAI